MNAMTLEQRKTIERVSVCVDRGKPDDWSAIRRVLQAAQESRAQMVEMVREVIAELRMADANLCDEPAREWAVKLARAIGDN
jgi:hypothetical protein